jgi:DNA-binding IclR family transcriptional regulator
MNPSTKPATVVPALEKALDILEYIAQSGTSVPAKELSTNLMIPHATVYRTVKYLCSRGYLKQDQQDEGEYSLGPQLLHLAHALSRQFDLLTAAGPIIRELAAKSTQTAQIGILQDLGVMYIDQALPTKPVNIIAALRTVIPVNVSASGKVLVAHLPLREQEYFLEHCRLAAQTPKSVVDIPLFRQELQKVRDQGYALDSEEYARGIGCAAAPIWDYKGQVIAAIGVTGPIADYTDETRLQRLIQLVKEASEELTSSIGGVCIETT